MRSEISQTAVAIAVVLTAAGLCAGMICGWGASDLVFYVCALAGSGLALVAASLARLKPRRMVFPVLAVGALALRLWFVWQTPTLSGDIYRYIWDGRIVNAGFNPYIHVPADPVLAPLRDPAQFNLIDKRDYAVTIYPPVAEGFYALVTRLSASVVAMKLAMVMAEAVAVCAIAVLLRRLGRPVEALSAYLLHPAPIWEIAGNGHVDAVMMALLFLGFVVLPAAGGSSYRSAALMTLATLAKPTAALGLPSLWRPIQIRLPLFVLALAALCYLPFLGAGAGIVGFLPSYAQEQGLANGQGVFWLALLGALAPVPRVVAAGYVVASAAAVLALALYLRRRGLFWLRSQLAATAALMTLALLLLTPMFPWYWVVLLPFAALLGWWSPFAFSTGGFLLYGFNADAPPFLLRWSLLIGFVVLAVIRDFRVARNGGVL